MLKPGLEDRRMFARLPATVCLGYVNIDSNKEGKCQTRDISANGIGLVTGKKLRTSTTLDIWLDVPGYSDPFYTRGEVIWVTRVNLSKYHVGVKLEKPELMTIARILESVKTEQNTSSQDQRVMSKKLLSKFLIFFRVRSA
ncbi:MAG: PilZ domain-containing protein [Candidatus Omnitrophica bacterium]|nr:PilZ domain-containing protein [Candidatus Omnitrophota bacterium]